MVSTRSRSGPRPYHMVLFIVALTFAFYVFAGRLVQLENLVAEYPQDENTLGSIFLEESYILLFEPIEDKAPEATLAKRKRYSQQYEAIVTYGLDGDLNQQYDTLLVGFGFSLSYSEKVVKAIGLKQIPVDVEDSSINRLREFLESYSGHDMAKDNVRMVLEKDGEASIQGS